MPTTIYWIHKFHNSAKIGIMARPRGDDWLEDEINNLKNNEVSVLVSLLERSEFMTLNLVKRNSYAKQRILPTLIFQSLTEIFQGKK